MSLITTGQASASTQIFTWRDLRPATDTRDRPIVPRSKKALDLCGLAVS
jgi:hypothetical protein